MNGLPVYFEQRLVGTIPVDRVGPGFVYDPGWIGLRGAFPISITMPMRPERYSADIFCLGRQSAARERATAHAGPIPRHGARDVIGLLSAIGGDTAGALSIGQPGRTSTVQWRPVGGPEDLAAVIAGLPSKPFLVGEEGVSMSLAGAQTKLAVAIDRDERICIPMNGSPSTHILKPESATLPGGVHNEAFCLTLARRLNIPTPDAVTGEAAGRAYLLTKRYDRTDMAAAGAGCIRRTFARRSQAAIGEIRDKPDWDRRAHRAGHVRPDPAVPAADRYRATPRHGDLQCAGLQHRCPREEFCHPDPQQRCRAGAALRRDVRRGVGHGNPELCPEDWRPKPRRRHRGKRLAVLRPRLRTEPSASGRPRGALAKAVLAATAAAQSEVAAMPAGEHPILDRTREAVERRTGLS